MRTGERGENLGASTVVRTGSHVWVSHVHERERERVIHRSGLRGWGSGSDMPVSGQVKASDAEPTSRLASASTNAGSCGEPPGFLGHGAGEAEVGETAPVPADLGPGVSKDSGGLSLVYKGLSPG